MKAWIVTLLFFSVHIAQANHIIKVHFLYGSKPKEKYKQIENKWFGGKLGGHVGVSLNSGPIINFIPISNFHVFSKSEINSAFVAMDSIEFYQIFDEKPNNKIMIIQFKINSIQAENFEKITQQYLKKSPYDYSFFGMRCAAATYDILCSSGIVNREDQSKKWFKNFYPRILRSRLLRQKNDLKIEIIHQKGRQERNWEQDRITKRKIIKSN